jgi:hypothetical protein
MVDWLTVFVSVGLSVLGSVVVTEYQIRREQAVEESAEVDDWYAETANYASQIRRTWQRLFDTPDQYHVSLSEIQSKLSLLEGQISRHATEGEQLGVDDDVIDSLDELADTCRAPSNAPLHSDSLEQFSEFRDDCLNAVEAVEESLEGH